MKKRILSLLLVLIMVLGMLPVSAMAAETEANAGYDIATGDTDSQGGQRVRVKNINISGVEVSRHQKTGDFSATVLLPAGTDKTDELTFTLDCVGDPNITQGKIFVNNAEVGTLTAKEGSTTEGTWTHTMVPEWNEKGEATIAFKSQWNTVSWVNKTYILNLRILGEENTAPTLKSGVTAETTALIAVGESYELKLAENPLWEDAELDDMSYTVSINDAAPVEASSTWYQFGPETADDYTLVFRCKDSAGNVSADTYTVKVTAMDLTRFETGGTAQDSWNADINRIEMGLAEVDEVILSEEEGVYAYAILDSETSKEDKLFFRVKASAGRNRFFGVNINDKGVDGAKTDAANLMWSAEYVPEWNDYGEASLKFVAQPQNDNKYVYTIRLKIANEENKAPTFADGDTATGTVEQYFDYTVDVASLFTGVDDSWLSYSVSVNNGEYEPCGDSYTITPKTTDTVTLKFKAKDIFGAESEAFVLTLNVSEYEVNEGSFAIDRMTDNGGLLSLTVKDADGNVIEGINFQSSTERKTQSFDSGSFAGMTFAWDETTIKVGLPETVGVSDKVVAHWHMVQNEAGLPFLSTADFYRDAVYNTKDGVATTLNGGVGSSTVWFYDDAEVEYEDCEYGDRYIVEYYIDRGENNKAPQLKEGVPSLAEVTMDQYQTYSVNLNDIFTEPDGDKVTYTVKADGETKEIGSSYSRELTTDEDVTLIFKATDALGATCTYEVKLTVNHVDRMVIQTGEGAGTFTSGINTFYLYNVAGEQYVLAKDGWNRNINIQLAASTPDDAQIDIQWEDSNDSVSMSVDNPVKLVDGRAEFTVESNGHFFDKQHRYYHFVISNTPNSLPVLAEGVEATAEVEKLVGTAYELDLSTIFTDADGDDMNYTVSVNGAEAVAAEEAYTYTQSVTGEYTLVFSAKDAWGTSEATYTVNLKVKNSDNTFDVVVAVPNAVTPAFYAFGGYDANEQDTLGDALTATKGESADGWTSYTVAVPDNLTRISFRGTDGTNDWGGMSIAVSEGMESVKLRQVNAIINTKIDAEGGKVAPTAEQAVFKIKYGADGYAVNGGSFNDSYGNLGYRFLLIAADNSLIYTYYAEPLGDLTGSYTTNEGGTKTVTTDVSTPVTAVMALGLKNSFTVTAPVGAEVVMYRQGGYFNYSAIPVASTVNNGDGTKNVVFNNVGSKAIFRVSMDGKVTKAGYSTANYGGEGSVVIDWEDDDRTPDYRTAYDTGTMMGSRGDDSMYVNVNYRNNLQLAVDETFQLRAYRIWEIIDTDTTNIMIEPDFHYNIISGSDVIDINPTDDIGGIAGNSWLDITAKKAGTAVLEVSYDAIEIVSMSKMGGFSNVDEDFTYNASDPARTALVVVQVGGAKNDINFGFDINRTEGWDVEFDTLYFTGDKGQLRLKPTVISGEGSVAKVEISGDKGKTYTTLTAGEDGYYTADIVSGNNIIRVTKDDGSEHYQVVRGDKVTLTITEVTGASDQDGVFEAGEKIKVKFNGVHNVIGKMSGIYNPTGYKTNFTFNGETVSGNGGQYTYPQAAYVEITIPGNAADGTVYTLTNGNTTNGGWGSAGGAHRAVTGEVPPGLDAGDITNSGRNVFPEVSITVGEEIVSADPVDPSTPATPDTPDTPDNPDLPDNPEGPITPGGTGSSLDFGLAESEIEGYVTVSFVDKGVRKSEELSEMDAQFRTPLGTIIPATRVPFKAYDTIASVTLRLLEENGFKANYQGDEYSSFYLAAIGDFTHRGTYYESFGEFDAGADSGWMITWDDWFINKGASEFMVKDGDVIKWQYTCQLGADIGDDDWMENGGAAGGIGTTTEDRTAAREVKGLIEAIGTVTKDSGAAIKAAREAYDALTDAQKDLVPNYDDLVAAEKKYAELTKDETKMIFTDVAEDAYYYEAVKWAVELGITNGTSDTTFSPNASCTRAQMVTFLWRAAGEPKAKSTTCVFTDVDKNAYYYEALLWGVENGITNGTSDTTFSPDAVCNRGQMATFLYRSAKTPVVSGNHTFIDVQADAYYNDAVIWAAARGITKGTSDTTFSPDADCTRGQMVTFLYRYLAK